MKNFDNHINKSKLERTVVEWLTERVGYYDEDDISLVLSDLMQGGCQSGIVSELIYHTDTIKFFNDHKESINKLLVESLESTGLSINELFGDKYDSEDPLCMDIHNQNLLAWFGFEETAVNVCREIGIEI